MSVRQDEQNPQERVAREVERIAREAHQGSLKQFMRARFWAAVHLALCVPAVILAALAGSILVAEWTATWLPGVLALVAAALMALVLGLSPSWRARVAQEAGVDFIALQERAERLHRLDLPGLGEQQARDALEQLVSRLEQLAHRAPAPIEHQPPR